MNAIAVVDVRVVPVGTGSTKTARLVARAYRVARESGLRHELTPTATVLEGDAGDLLDVALRMHAACLGQGVERVVTSITLDERTDRETDGPSLGHRVASVMEELSRELSPA